MNNNYILRKVADEYMLVPIGDNTVVVRLNETGAFIWEQYNAGYDADAIATALTEKYIVSKEQATEDVEKILIYLKEHSVI
ncbi:MAG: PqqD family protein [Acutalibacteraceae bacterium]